MLFIYIKSELESQKKFKHWAIFKLLSYVIFEFNYVNFCIYWGHLFSTLQNFLKN